MYRTSVSNKKIEIIKTVYKRIDFESSYAVNLIIELEQIVVNTKTALQQSKCELIWTMKIRFALYSKSNFRQGG